MTNDKKQQAIIEAYQALGMNVPHGCDENGWKDISFFELVSIDEVFLEIEGDLARPILLEGIESNNGWIRILEDGSNLPTENVQYYLGYFRKDNTFFQSNSRWTLGQARHALKSQNFTHYQPIVKPKPPIY